MKTRASGYSSLQIGLHWIVAALIFAAWFLGDGMGRLLRQKLEGADVSAPLHVILGLAVLALVVIRIIVKLVQGVPPQIESGHALADKAAHYMHLVLYLLMLLVPIGGILVWGAGIEAFGEVHELAGNALFFLAVAHAAVGLFHGIVKKDGIMARMLRPAA
jgi:cytochrome b561